MNKAKEIIELEKKWEEMDSKNLSDNIRSVMHHCDCVKYKDYCEKMMEITDSTSHTVEAWLNTSRADVKIPFLKLCKLVAHYDVDIYKILENYQCKSENQEERYKYLYGKIVEQ